MSHRALGPQFFHGTVSELKEGDSVLPASQSGRKVVHRSMTDPEYAYATETPEAAWHYAELTWNHAESGHPRVYRVVPLGEHEEDPQVDSRGQVRGGVFEGDRRSKHGWKVEEELPMPERMGRPEDWR